MLSPRFALPAVIGAALLLAACSSSGHSTSTTSSPSATPTSTRGSSGTTTSAPSSSAAPTTGPGSPPTTTATASVRIISFTGPRSPVQCNAPTSVELEWQTQGAASVTLQIDGAPVFARYSDGAHRELAPLTCDGNPQTYLLTARAANGATASKTITLAESETT